MAIDAAETILYNTKYACMLELPIDVRVYAYACVCVCVYICVHVCMNVVVRKCIRVLVRVQANNFSLSSMGKLRTCRGRQKLILMVIMIMSFLDGK